MSLYNIYTSNEGGIFDVVGKSCGYYWLENMDQDPPRKQISCPIEEFENQFHKTTPQEFQDWLSEGYEGKPKIVKTL